MATLQKIRNKGVLIATVIGLALFAFLAGDAIKNAGALFGKSKNEIGVIADESISIRDFQKKVKHNQDLAQMMSGQSSLSSEQMDKIREQTWQQLIQEIVMNNEYNELGIEVGSEELFELVQGDNLSPIITQMFRGQDGSVDKAKILQILKQLVAAPDGTPQKRYWLNIENQIKASKKAEKYNQLVLGLLNITKARAKHMLDLSSKKVDFSYVVKKYSSISDNDVKVSDSEIQKYYDSHKYLFEQNESRKIEYVAFDIEPSEEDFATVKKNINDIKKEFTAVDKNKEYVNLNSDVKFIPSFVKANQIKNEDLAKFVKGGKVNDVYGPYMEGNTYKVAKINKISSMPDSVKVRHIVISPVRNDIKATKAKADSIMKLINKGADFAKLAKKFSADKQSAVNGGDLGWFDVNATGSEFVNKMFFAKKGVAFIETSQYGVHIMQVTKQLHVSKKFQLATVVRTVDASQKTYNNIYANAVKFAQDVKDDASFNATVEKYKVTKRIAQNINKNAKGVSGIKNARELVKNIYKTEEANSVVTDKDGNSIFELNDKYIIAVVTEINEKGTSPINKVSSSIKRQLINKKKGEMLAKKMSKEISNSKSILSVAQKEGVEVKEANGISFQSFQVGGAGIEPKLIATATTIAKGKISKPIIGNQGVYVLVVNNTTNTKADKKAVEQMKAQMQNMFNYRARYQTAGSLIENANIEDMRYKFY